MKSFKIIDQKFRENGIMPISSKLELIDWEDKKNILIGKVGPVIPILFKDQEGRKSVLIQFWIFRFRWNSRGIWNISNTEENRVIISILINLEKKKFSKEKGYLCQKLLC